MVHKLLARLGIVRGCCDVTWVPFKRALYKHNGSVPCHAISALHEPLRGMPAHWCITGWVCRCAPTPEQAVVAAHSNFH